MGKRGERFRAKVKSLKTRIKKMQQELPQDDFHIIYGLAMLSLSVPDSQKKCLELASRYPNGQLLFEILKDIHYQESLWVSTIPKHAFERMVENWKYYKNNSELKPEFIYQIFGILTDKHKKHWRGNIPPEKQS
jgi:hypothetical protein